MPEASMEGEDPRGNNDVCFDLDAALAEADNVARELLTRT